MMTAYWVGRVQVSNAEAYARYAELAGPAIEKHGGRFLARGGKHVTLEGEDYPRVIVVEFPSLDQAVACYNSDEYQAAWALQKDAAIREICVVEGL